MAASVGVGIVSSPRISYGMAARGVLPPVLGRVNHRYSTPVIASVVMGVVLVAIIWVYLLSTSIANVFSELISVVGLLYAGFYILTAAAVITFYRRRIISNAWELLLSGILPLCAAGFLIWITVKTLQTATAPEFWSLIGITASGVFVMLLVRFILRPDFFHTPRESAPKERPS